MFVDGVRRVEARGVDRDGRHRPVPGIFASFAAGAVRCDGVAKIVDPLVGRGVFAPGDGLDDIDDRVTAASSRTRPTTPRPQKLMKTLLGAMAELEVRVAERARRAGDELSLLDGPLKHRRHVPQRGRHREDARREVPPNPRRTASSAMLGAGQAHARLPRRRATVQPVLVVRAAARARPADRGRASSAARRRARSAPQRRHRARRHASTAILPTFASAPHKDARAPQNLYPIGGLERHLRHRLGDAAVIYRALRRASSVAPTAG